MKKFLIVLSIVLFLVIGYLLYALKQANDKVLISGTGDYKTVSNLEKELSIKIEELSGLQMENQELKDELSGTIESLNFLQLEKSGLEESLSGCENKLDKYIEYIKKLREENDSNVGDITDDVINTTNTSNSNTDNNNSKEVGIIKQIYNDKNGNRKIEIDYVQLRGYGENGCEYPLCIVNENPKLRTFTVSNNVQVIMKTLTNSDQIISFDYLNQIFNTNDYSEYKYLKDIPFRITIENNIIVKIEEQYVS